MVGTSSSLSFQQVPQHVSKRARRGQSSLHACLGDWIQCILDYMCTWCEPALGDITTDMMHVLATCLTRQSITGHDRKFSYLANCPNTKKCIQLRNVPGISSVSTACQDVASGPKMSARSMMRVSSMNDTAMICLRYLAKCASVDQISVRGFSR